MFLSAVAVEGGEFRNFILFVITCNIFPKPCLFKAFCFGLALSVVFNRTELSDYLGLLGHECRLRIIALSLGLVAMVFFLVAFFGLLRCIDSVKEEAGLRLLNVGDEAMDERIVTVIVDFDHRFIYNLNCNIQKRVCFTKIPNCSQPTRAVILIIAQE